MSLKFNVLSAIGASVLAIMAMPANAAVFACGGGNIDLTVDQCVASGNDHLADVEAAIAAATGVAVDSLNLSLYGKSDANPSWFNFSPNGDPSDGKTTDWTVLDGTLIKYVTVKAATSFKIYELAAASDQGFNFSTVGMLNGGGKQPDISHLSFWTVPSMTAVPEPSTWAMMILGIGFAGAAVRCSRQQVGVSCS